MPEIHGFIICEDVQPTRSRRWSAIGIISHLGEHEINQPIDLAAYCHISKIPGRGVDLSVQILDADSNEFVWEMQPMRAPPEDVVETWWEGKIPLENIQFPVVTSERILAYYRAVLLADGTVVAQSQKWSIG
jgi:hypothetical protein